MELREDGKYYLDGETEFTYDLFCEITDQFNIKFFYNKEKIYKNINGKTFNFYMEKGLFCISKKDEDNPTKLSFNPINCKFIVSGKEYPIYIYTFEQYQKIKKYLGLTFPWSNTINISDKNIRKRIYDLNNKNIVIQEIDLFKNNYEEPNINEKKFKNLSKFIHCYIKNKINFNEYEESKFIDKSKYNINPNSEYIFFDKNEKYKFNFDDGEKEFFFTGPYSIGKTFSLLEYKLNSILDKTQKIAYYNLEALSKEKNYFEIIAYESRNLFENNEDWKEIFLEISNLGIKEYFDILIKLIELIPNKKSFRKNIKYIYILDQIKFKYIEEDNYEFKKINKIREIIKNINNYYLIGCCSINYHGVKTMLFNNWFHQDNDNKQLNLRIPKIYYFRKFQQKNNRNNKYLNLLGNLTGFRHIKNNLDSKYINIMCKRIKKKLLKFYNDNENIAISKLKQLKSKINKSIEIKKDYQKLLDVTPIKYFIIDNQNNTIDYLYPLVQVAIEEIINTSELNKFNGATNNEKEWYFKRKVIYDIKTTHIINDIYIDNYYQIKSIFLKDKINDSNFDKNENSLFYFQYCNALRYDCAVYLGNENALLLIQIVLYKNKKQIEIYNDNNFQKDINSMQKFLRINNLEIRNYYLLFIFNKDEYSLSDFDTIKSKYFKYNIYDLENSCFFKKENNYYQINYLPSNIIDDERENDSLKFSKRDGSFCYNSNEIFQYYIYKGMTLEEFMEQIFGDDIDSPEIIFNLKGKDFFFKNKYTYNDNYYNDMNDSTGDEIFFIAFIEDKIYFGNAIINKISTKINLKVYDIFLKIFIENVHSNSLTGFIFKKNKSIDITNISK